jgi:hypothetical protein
MMNKIFYSMSLSLIVLMILFGVSSRAYAEADQRSLGTVQPGTCQAIMQDTVTIDGEQEQKKTISQTGVVRWLCDKEPAGSERNAIEVLIEKAADWLLGLANIVFMVMIGIGMVQIMAGGMSPEAIKAGKKRIFQAASSIALFALARVTLDLIGVTGGNFLGVPVGNFGVDTIYEIIQAIYNYIAFAGGALAVTMIIAGGIRMMTAAGNPQQIQTARKIITYAIIGLLGILSVQLITGLIGKIITG